MTFQRSLTILSSASNAHYYKKLTKGTLKDSHYGPPKRIKLIDEYAEGVSKEPFSWKIETKSDFDSEGDVLPISSKAHLEVTLKDLKIKSLTAKNNGEALPYDNLVIDEWGEFLDRVHAEITSTCVTKKGEIDTRTGYVETAAWTNTIVGWLKQLTSACGMGVAVVMHDRDPDKDRKGGPKAPSATISASLCAKADGVIQRLMKDGNPLSDDPEEKKVRRIWCATAGEKWYRKLRGLEPEDEARIANMTLYDILELADFDMSPEEC